MKTVTAAVICRDGQVLAAQRPAKDRDLAHLWEFPGGKVEPGETHEEGLARELREELGVEARIGGLLLRSRYAYRDGEIEMFTHWVTVEEPKFQLLFHQAFKWCDRETLRSISFAPADVPIVDRLLALPEWPGG